MNKDLNEHIQKILYKSKYILGESTDFNKSQILDESKKTEQEATNKLQKAGIDNTESIINDFKTIDKTKNQVLLPAMAAAYAETKNIQQVKDIFSSASELINSQRLQNIQHTKRGYVVGNKTFDDFMKFSEHIHSIEGALRMKDTQQQGKDEKINTEEGEKPIWENEKIAIYDGNNIESCIRYGKGSLTGKQYNFCIGQYGSSNMWQSYRDNYNASFYYIVDKEKYTNDPFHIVVWMPTNQGVLLTHEPNNTKEESSFDSSYANSEFGMGYREYLKRNGVPVDKILKDVPKTPEENSKNEIIGRLNLDLDWFKNLGKKAQENGLFTDMTKPQATFKMMSDYIGRGHLLSSEQFKYLWGMRNPMDGGGFQLLKKYLDTGQSIPEEQFDILTGRKNME